MKGVRARLGDQIDYGSNRMTILGGKRATGGLELFNRLDADRVDACARRPGGSQSDPIRFAEAHIHAIQHEITSQPRCAVNLHAAPVCGKASRVPAWLERHQLPKIPPI